MLTIKTYWKSIFHASTKKNIFSSEKVENVAKMLTATAVKVVFTAEKKNDFFTCTYFRALHNSDFYYFFDNSAYLLKFLNIYVQNNRHFQVRINEYV